MLQSNMFRHSINNKICRLIYTVLCETDRVSTCGIVNLYLEA